MLANTNSNIKSQSCIKQVSLCPVYIITESIGNCVRLINVHVLSITITLQ